MGRRGVHLVDTPPQGSIRAGAAAAVLVGRVPELAYPELRRPAAMPLMVRWMAGITRGSGVAPGRFWLAR